MYIYLINDFLRSYALEYNVNFKSHFFTINLITQLCRKTTIHKAQQLVGHRDIRSTARYNRYKLTKKDKLVYLGQAF